MNVGQVVGDRPGSGRSPTPPLGHAGVAFTREAAGEFTMLAARAEKDLFQFRDLRAKAGTDKTELSGSTRAAQREFGRASIKMAGHYVRERKRYNVDPTR